MGMSWSNVDSSRRRNDSTHNPPPPPPPLSLPPPPFFYSLPPPPPPPPQGYFFPLNSPYAPPPPCSNFVTPPPPLTLPQPQPQPQPQPPHSVFYSIPNGYISYVAEPVVGHVPYNPYFMNQHYGWFSPRPSSAANSASLSTPPPPPYVDHGATKKIKNNVNVHKDTLCLQVDELNPDRYLVSFVFDAVHDGSITIIYFAKEEEKCRFVPLFPDVFEPVRVPFQKGVGQHFVQPSGTGIGLGFFQLGDLSKSSPEGDAFPLVICAETCFRTPSMDETPGGSMLDAPPHMQITQCVLERSNGGGAFQIKVVRQILWIDGVRYELRELYGIGSSGATDFDDSDPGKECVICMTEPKDTAVLPCRHMCMCSVCAKTLRLQSNRCPLCRQSIEELIEIKMNNCIHQ